LVAPAEVVEAVLAPHLAVVAQSLVLPVRAHLEAVVAPALVPLLLALAHLPLLQAVVVLLVLAVRAHRVLLALLRVVVVLPALAGEAVPLHLHSRQSFSAAMARSTP